MIDIKEELKAAIKIDINKSILQKINEEIDILEKTEDPSGENCLRSFYDIWKKHNGEIGTVNNINSWLAYVIGLTSAKPDGDFLPARRIYARSGYPDVDIDFDPDYQTDVQDYLIRKYGEENVANIGTIQTLKIKDTVRRLVKALDCAYAYHKGKDVARTENTLLADQIAESLPKERSGAIWWNIDGKETKIKSIKQAAEHIPDFKAYMEKYPQILEHAKYLEGNLRGKGVHAAGIVISSVPLKTIAPLYLSRKRYATVFPFEELEMMGLIKIDILAIATLSVIRRTIKLVEQNYGFVIDLDKIPLDDQETFKLYQSGRLVGVFQCENYGMQKTIKDLQPTSLDDIMATIALYRPGPMNAIPDYIARKKGEKPIDYFHPTIAKHVKDIMEKTYGIAVYQEQIMKIMQSLAGFSPSEGYVIIKAIGKKKENLMKKYKDQFVAGCVEKEIPSDVADQYWEKFITPFAGYGFNLAHSACYAFLSYQTAYLKANYPDEFYVSLLNTLADRADWDKHDVVEKDLRKLKYTMHILDKDVNASDVEWKIERKKNLSSGIKKTEIRPGILVKGMGPAAAVDIVANRPYKNMMDFAYRTNREYVTSEKITALLDAGFYGDKVTDAQKIEISSNFDKIRKDIKKSKDKGIDPTQDLFGD